jgi:serine/threonine-protein kinase
VTAFVRGFVRYAMNCPSCQAENVEGARFCAKCGALIPAAEEPEVDKLIGQTVGGRYVIQKILGEGGMGRVYAAERMLAGASQRVAVKTLHSHLSSDPQIVARFHRECRTMAGLRHPNTIKVEDFGQTADGTLYIAMEFVSGNSVEKELEKGPMPPERVEKILGQVCGSLAEAHKQGIIHRDLKPDNVVLMDVGDDEDFVKVLDFGIAARKDSVDAAKEQKLTQQGMVLGTPPYMSPEQFMGKELDSRSDIYSLGVMAYEMLTGRLPFEANTPWEWATKHMTAQPFPFEDSPTVTDIPGKMKTAILRAMSKNPDERFATVKEFFEELSLGNARMRGATTSAEIHGGAAAVAPGTAVMTPYEAGKGATQVGEPMGIGSSPSLPGGSSPSLPGGASPSYAGAPPAVVPAAPAYAAAAAAPASGGNKGLLFAGLGGGLLLLIVAIIFIVKSRPDGPGGTVAVDPNGSDAGTANVQPAGGDSASPSGTTTVKLPPPPVTTTKPALTGDAACAAAIAEATSDVIGAAAHNRSCTGAQQGTARAAIAANAPKQALAAVRNGDCRRARAVAAAGSSVGASVNVDALEGGKCKGK